MRNVEPAFRDGHVLFWGSYLSNWHRCRFAVDGVEYNCGEQWMMAEKARLFGDAAALEKIMAAADPRKQKALGRRVRNFDPARWNDMARDLLYRGLLEKFRQNPQLKADLLATGEAVIVEASPQDTIWGIGLHADDPRATDPSQWLGSNWLGEVLMRVRATLRCDRIQCGVGGFAMR